MGTAPKTAVTTVSAGRTANNTKANPQLGPLIPLGF
jgi:hypothetical protein